MLARLANRVGRWSNAVPDDLIDRIRLAASMTTRYVAQFFVVPAIIFLISAVIVWL